MSLSFPADGLELSPPASDETGHRAELTVAAGSPWFDGHFPGHPVLPAIAHLAVAVRLHRLAGERGSLAGIDALRFSGPVRPGERLVAQLAACDANGRARFRLARAGDDFEVSSGTLVWGSPSADEVPDGPDIGQAPEALAADLPHSGPSRLLESVVVLGDGQVAGHGRVPAGHAAVHEGQAPAFLAAELAAQAASQVPLAREREDDVGSDHSVPGGDEPRLGYLVRLRDVRFARGAIEVAESLVAHVDLAGRTGPLARFDFVVVLPGGEPIAGGSLAIWELVEER